VGLFEYILSFKNPNKKKSGAVKSGERGGHAISALREINLFQKIYLRIFIELREILPVTPSC
jgi:hypothetical protein